MTVQPVLIDGAWRPADAAGAFQAVNPLTCEPLPEQYPKSSWSDCDAALDAATSAARALEQIPVENIARFLECFAERIESKAKPLVEMAHRETALPVTPRLADVELPRTTNQLRQAAAAAREGSWQRATIDSKANIRSHLAPLGPVCVFGPNNFPFAFNSIAGGDFAAAIAAGAPVIAKANSSHPGTTRLFAEIAFETLKDSKLPAATVQLIYRLEHADGERLVADPRTGASAYTGSRSAGLMLKAAADRAGKPIYLELSSINPVAILPAALRERGEQIASEFTTSCLMGTGQFCTNPGLLLLLAGPETDAFIAEICKRFQAAPIGTLLSAGVARSLGEAMCTLQAAGAKVIAGGTPGGGKGFCHANTLLRVGGAEFLDHAEALQTEAFGNSSLLVVADHVEQASRILESLEGNLTGCIYSDTAGGDDAIYRQLAPILRRKVGRLLNDKMPTGVAVSPAMNHGGPYPATGHPGFTAVGLPAAMVRFARLDCYDNVPQSRLPWALRDKNPTGKLWRSIDGVFTVGDVA